MLQKSHHYQSELHYFIQTNTVKITNNFQHNLLSRSVPNLCKEIVNVLMQTNCSSLRPISIVGVVTETVL